MAYAPAIDDVNSRLRVEYMPVRDDDGVRGSTVVAGSMLEPDLPVNRQVKCVVVAGEAMRRDGRTCAVGDSARKDRQRQLAQEKARLRCELSATEAALRTCS